ncbi:MAG TPA: lipid-binding SYLF domain-containing protein [Verrucomicrobiae bacterium]|nr:lipid-binding SYLF domain-containing protein [Verrucomicrobiae bacterium]
MKKKILNITVAALSTAALFAVNALAADDLAVRAQQTIANFQAADSSLKSFMDSSAGYAVFPSVGKGGLIVGGARGAGLLFENGAIAGRTTLTQGSIGAQAGGQTFSQIIVFQSPSAVSNFKDGKFQLGADVNAVALSSSVSKSVPLSYTRGLAVFTMQQSGLMVQAAVSGQRFTFEPLMPTGR